MTSESSRRGQHGASGAAILIAIIAGLMVLYLLFLPPADREEILFGDGQGGPQYGAPGGYGGGAPIYHGAGSGGVFRQYGPTILLTATPGTLRLLTAAVIEHSLPSATIFTRLNTHVVKSMDSAIVKNGVFAQRGLDIEFTATRRAATNYLLSFNVDKAGSSPLRVLVNGHVLYERPVRERSPPPIALPVDYLQDGTNTVTLETDSIGLAFWKPNTYHLHNVLISADLIDVSGSVSEQTFSMPESELSALERAELQFVPECDPRDVGRLTVQLNKRYVRNPVNVSQVLLDENNRTVQVPNILYSGHVDCGVLFKTDVAAEYLHLGENRLLFASDGGQYVVSRVKVISHLRENDYPVYYFNIPPDMYDVIDHGQQALRLTMAFPDYRGIKSGEVVLNGFVQSFHTPDVGYQALLDPAIITPGPNTIQIVPHVDKLDVREMRIELL
ncbi:MAG: hypothetical protein OXR66_06360 [Candidatus Woesearchaeota archaeon]|nr:hypothetical protein [Candidatus Woesearchaeota archaeon]